MLLFNIYTNCRFTEKEEKGEKEAKVEKQRQVVLIKELNYLDLEERAFNFQLEEYTGFSKQG